MLYIKRIEEVGKPVYHSPKAIAKALGCGYRNGHLNRQLKKLWLCGFLETNPLFKNGLPEVIRVYRLRDSAVPVVEKMLNIRKAVIQ